MKRKRNHTKKAFKRNRKKQAELQISRKTLDLPKLILNNKIKDIDDFSYEDISIEGYQHHPHISAPISI